MLGASGISSVGEFGNAVGPYRRFSGFGEGGGRRPFAKRPRPKTDKRQATAAADLPPSGAGIDAETHAFLLGYTREMHLLQAAAGRALEKSGADFSITSSAPQVAKAVTRWRTASPAAYEVTVLQLAQKQTNLSRHWRAAAANQLFDKGSLQLLTRSGGLSLEMHDFAEAPTNAVLLSAAAEAINGAQMGVTAKVLRSEDSAALQVQAEETGTAAEFVLTGTFAEYAGFNTAALPAQDAVYRVNGREAVTDANEINLDDYRVAVTLQSPGTARIRVGGDSEALAQEVAALSAAYARVLQYLESYAGVGSGVLQQRNRLLALSAVAPALQQVGVFAEDGAFRIDRKIWNQQSEAAPQALIFAVRALAAELRGKAQQGLQMPSYSLVDKTAAPTPRKSTSA